MFNLTKSKMKNEMLTGAALQKQGFERSKEASVFDVWTFRQMEITLIEGKEDYPKVRVYTANEWVDFPGCFTVEDVRDLKHFLYSED